MAERLYGRCEFEGDCPTLKTLLKLIKKPGERKFASDFFETQAATNGYNAITSNYCNFGQYGECPTRQELSRRAENSPGTNQKKRNLESFPPSLDFRQPLVQ